MAECPGRREEEPLGAAQAHWPARSLDPRRLRPRPPIEVGPRCETSGHRVPARREKTARTRGPGGGGRGTKVESWRCALEAAARRRSR
jgi:hypothetical protein